jgi:hypothetical protein
MNYPDSIRFLISALRDKDSNIRMKAAEVLGNMGNPLAVEPLILSLDDRDKLVQQFVLQALVKITGEHFGKNSRKWIKWWRKHRNELLKDYAADSDAFFSKYYKERNFGILKFILIFAIIVFTIFYIRESLF